ncbi:DsbC family protein [uncultured Parasutterella sp.]|uniref:DsbC family protein n=1 Tax=uncultured Parasutterella sp. TaxID=1263098 RepID=UPI002598CB1D|nr:DsbC family protein [uncultured Parasutterella sp.]
MIKSKFSILLVSALGAFSTFAFANAASCGNTAAVVKTSSESTSTAKVQAAKYSDLSRELKQAVENFQERYPKTQVKLFSLTPVKGIFEASVGKEVIYFDSSARFLFSGRLLDMDQGVDEKRVRDLRRIAFNSLPLDKAVKTVYGNGSKKLAVFTDVDCPYSRKLAQTLKDLKDTTVYTFLFPLESIHPKARAKSDAVWCAKDSSTELSKALKGTILKQLRIIPYVLPW